MNKEKKPGIFSRIKGSKYYEAAEAGFWRIWKNKTIWFWGLFISSGMFFNLGGSDSKEEETFNEGIFSDFIISNWQWLLILVLFLMIFCFLIWIISGIARVGVIKEFDNKQNKKNYKLEFKKIWKIGKKDFVRILKLDLSVGGIILAILCFDAVLFLVVFLINNIFLIVFTAIVIIILSILTFLLLLILKPWAEIYLILSNLTIKDSFVKSWNLIKHNFKEFFKLILTLLTVSFISGIILVSLITLIGIILSLLYSIFIISIGENSIVLIIFTIILVIFFLISLLIFKAFASLWRMDILIWWIKMIDGVKVAKKIKKPEAEEKIVISRKVTVGAGA